MPCQDFALGTRGRQICAIALADGAGSSSHSEIGARIVVKEILKLLRTEFHLLLRNDNYLCDENLAADKMAHRIMERLLRCLNRCACELMIDIKSLASTLLFVATDGVNYLCGQIGDGRIAAFNSDLTKSWSVFKPSKGEFFNQTVFVTSQSAWDDLALEWGDVEDLGGFVLMSDGAEESLYNRINESFAPAVGRMIGWLDCYPEKTVSKAVTTNLENLLKEKTVDDMSLALIRLTCPGFFDPT